MSSGIIILFLFIGILIASGFSLSLYKRARNEKTQFEKKQRELEERESKMNQKMYELAILKELGDRVGYSLDVHQIVDVITGSLHQFIEYSAVSYMLIEPEKILFKAHLEKSVHRTFIDEVRDRMLKSLSALLDKEFKKDQVIEILSGAILVDEVEEPVRSFFNIPLVIGDKVVGVLTVAHTITGLYKEEEMTILYKITGQASKAVSKLQDVVKTEQEKLNAIMESMADGVVMTDMDYRVMVANPAAKRLLGIKENKDVTIFDFIDKLGGKFDIRGRLEESVKLKKNYVGEKILIDDKFYQIFVFPVVNKYTIKEGEVLGGVAIFHDITHEIELERIREDFTSMIVHELRSPLDGIKKISELLRGGVIKIGEKERNEYFQMIYQSASGMLELVNDILDLAKLEAGKFEVSPQPADITEAVNNRVRFYETLASDAGIKIAIVFSKDLPKEIKFDARAIYQVLNNFLSNAIKFSKEGGEIKALAWIHKKGGSFGEELGAMKIKSPVEIPKDELRETPDSLIVAVTDTGAGISPENITQLFNKFKQLNALKVLSKKGTGLGLAIVKEIITAHKGAVGVLSKEGTGSIFYFALPLNL